MVAAFLARFSRTSERVRLAGGLLLVIGLLAAGWAYWAASREPDPLLTHGYELVGGQVYASVQADVARQQQIERVGGKAAVWAVEFNEWLGAQFEGTRLATTLLILAALVALACFHIANVIEEHEAG